MRTFPRLLRSRRGLILILATTAGLLAFFTPEPWSDVFGVLALLGYGALILILSVRFSDSIARLRRAERQLIRQTSPVLRRPRYDVDERIAVRMTGAVDLLESSMRRLDHETEIDEDPRFEDTGSTPWVTVVVPCHNEEHFVADTLRSIANQTLNNWECVVVDDASTDGSLREIWSIAGSDDRFRVLRHQENGGLSASRNTGLRAARGRFITFLDADDLLMRDSLMDRVATLLNAVSDPHVIGAYCGVTIGFEEAALEDFPVRMEFDGDRVIDFVTADSECPFNAHAPLLITDNVRSLGGFDETMRLGAEDWDLWYRAMRNGFVFVPSKFRTAVYRQKRHSMVRSMADGHVQEASRLIGSAHQAADPNILVAPSPTPLTRPIAEYQAALRLADRAIRFAAMALVAGDEPAATRALTTIAQVPPALLERHLNLNELTSRGLQRALALGPSELDAVTSLAQPIRDRLQALLTRASARFEPGPLAVVDPISVGALLIPQHAGQLTDMIKAAVEAGYEQDDMAVLRIEREAGVQGATADIPSTLPSWSLNQWTLNNAICEAVVVGQVRVSAVDQVARSVAALGGQVIEVPQPNADVMQIAEAHRARIEVGRRSPVVAGKALIGLLSSPEGVDVDPAATWRVEESPLTVFDATDLLELKGRHAGERVVIIGNGPSLNDLDLTRLKSENTIAVNAIFYAEASMGFDPTYYVVEDTAVMRDNLESVIAYEAGHKFFPSIYRSMVGEHNDVTYFMMNRGFYEPLSPDFCIPRFSMDPAQRIYSGQSVTIINLQLAYHLGFQEVVLIGMDFSYTIPAESRVDGDVITSTGPDPNHFHPDYFGAGKVWKDPKLDRVLANYALAKGIFEADGRRIVNATAGGHLELFERVDYTDLF